jgi:NADP-dependent 3-hydroxy acid dehydrogenase YdfG
MNQIDLAGRVAIVTGGAQGIGLAVAERFVASGAKVVLWDIDEALLAKARAQIGAAATTARVELTDEAQVAQAAQAVLAAHGRIDILVNNAGITGGNGPTWELDARRVAPHRVIDVNLVAPYLTCRAVVPAMLSQGYGRIVNVASVAGKEGNPNASHYSASKAGLIALTKSLAKEVATKGIARQRGVAGRGAHGHLRPDDAAAHRLHAGQDPDGPVRRAARDRRGHRLAGQRGLLVHHRLGGRPVGRARHLLTRAHAARGRRAPARHGHAAAQMLRRTHCSSSCSNSRRVSA